MASMEAVKGDITRERVDAIVNAANESLLGGGGVDGAIHRAAGPELLDACRAIGGCPTGQARITPAFDLPARYVIHTVGPVYGSGRDASLLASCYTASLDLAASRSLASIAFPCIATGAYGYPAREAAGIAVRSVRAWLSTHDVPMRVRFVCFSDSDLAIYSALLASSD